MTLITTATLLYNVHHHAFAIMKFFGAASCFALLSNTPAALAAIDLDVTNSDSIKKAAAIVADDLLSYYTGNRPGDVPGNLPSPYYWWQAGAMFGGLINYWYYTGDTTHNALVKQAMIHQIGDNEDYMPDNQTKTLGNDDQGFWGMAAMTAAETRFEDPDEGTPGWLALAQAVFNVQVPRWDTEHCKGGLRWQIFPFNKGFTYKNSISNGCLFNIASRLALYTGNETYADWASKVFEWQQQIGFITPDYTVYDGAHLEEQCTAIDKNAWNYNNGIFLMGAAAMYNHTNGAPEWKAHLDGLLQRTVTYFNDGVMFEICEPVVKCNIDQRSHKAYLARWMAGTTQLAPYTAATLLPLLASSATAAMKTCTAGPSGTQCGLTWSGGQNDGLIGVGESMSALEIVQSNLVPLAPGWVSAVAGTGTSQGNANAGVGSVTGVESLNKITVTSGDRVGAGFLTFTVLGGVIGGSIWMAF